MIALLNPSTLYAIVKLRMDLGGRDNLSHLVDDAFIDGQPYEHSLKRVLVGETTFEDMFQPLLGAIVSINPRTGTDSSFDAIAAKAKEDLWGVISQRKLDMLVEPIPSRRKAFWSEYWQKTLASILAFAISVFVMNSVGVGLNQMWPVLPFVLLAAFILATLHTSWPGEIIASRSRLAADTLEFVRELDAIVATARKPA